MKESPPPSPAREPRPSRRDRIRRLVVGKLEARAVARGLAVGVFIALSPFIGLQAVLALLLALLLRLDKLATLLGAASNPPWLWPIVYPAAYGIGRALLGESGPADLDVAAVMEGGLPELAQLLVDHGAPLVLGTTVLGAVAAPCTYVLAFAWVRRVRARLEPPDTAPLSDPG